MTSGFSFAVNGNNCTLSYTTSSASFNAQIRVNNLTYNYGVSSDESHARDERAFYPHRRLPGQFAITPDCLGYNEFNQLMTWLRNYSDALLNDNASGMTVNLPSRNFRRLGILTTGIDDHDQTGSMVFNPQLVFLTLTDPSDPTLPQIRSSSASQFVSPQVDANASIAFYPVTVGNYKDSLLYDDLSTVSPYAAVVVAINPNAPGSDIHSDTFNSQVPNGGQ